VAFLATCESSTFVTPQMAGRTQPPVNDGDRLALHGGRRRLHDGQRDLKRMLALLEAVSTWAF